MSEASICVGGEFGFGALGELLIAGAVSGAWPYACPPSLGSDLRTDPVQGLWVPPRVPVYVAQPAQKLTSTPLPFTTYVNPFAAVPLTPIVNPSSCFPLQAVVAFELNAQLQFTSADVWIKAASWMGPSTASAPDPATLPVQRTMYNQWAEAVSQNDSVSVNLVRRVGVPPGGSVNVAAQLWLYAQANPGSSVTQPNITQATSTSSALAWYLTDGETPVTDLGEQSTGAPGQALYTSTGTRQSSQAAAENGGQVTSVYTNVSGGVQAFAFTDSWTLPLTIGGTAQGEPSIAASVPGTYHVLWRGSDNALWHAVSTTDGLTWSSPASLGGSLTSQPQAVADASGFVHVVYRGSDAAVWYVRYNPAGGGTWSAPASLGGSILSGSFPVACTTVSGTAWVFYQDSAAQNLARLETTNSGATWSAPTVVSSFGNLGSVPSATGKANGNVHVFWRGLGADSQLYQALYTPSGGWTGPLSRGGAMASGTRPLAVTSADYTTDAFFKGTDGNLWYVNSNDWGTHWSSAASLGQGPIGQPWAAGQTTSQIDVFWRDPASGGMYNFRFNPVTGWPSRPFPLGGALA